MWQTLIPELITEIILQSFAPEWVLSLHEPDLFPWYLGHICCAWRSVFVSTPQFWSNITFDNRRSRLKSLCHFEHALSMTKMCMERSRDHLLSFRFCMHIVQFPLGPIPTPCCHEILETLARHSTRWYDVYLTLPPSELQMLYTVKNRLPTLRSILLKVTTLQLSDQNTLETTFSDPTFSNLFIDTPRLRRISLDHLNYDCSFWKIDWSLITVIHYNSPRSPHAFTSILRQATAIEELAIFDTFDFEIQPHTICPVALPSLKVLHAATMDTLSLLEAPSLEKLSIRDDLCPVDSIMLESITFNLFHPLRHLMELVIWPESERSARTIMKNLPEVHHLIFRSRTTVPARRMLEILSQCPQAQSFREVTYGEWDFKENTLEEVSAVIANWANQKSTVKGIGSFENLTHFSLETAQGDLPEHCLDLPKRHFKEHGISFSIKYYNRNVDSPTFGSRAWY